jgi:hypothetical protein
MAVQTDDFEDSPLGIVIGCKPFGCETLAKVQIGALDRSHDETAELASKVSELSPGANPFPIFEL